MPDSTPLDYAVGSKLVPAPNAKQASGDRSVRLGWSRLFSNSRIEPIIRRMFPDKRRYERLLIPHVVAYLGNAHASRPHQIANISVGGFCMLSEEQWTPGTEMPITLQREDWDGDESTECVSVQAMVVRCGHREIGFSIRLSAEESVALPILPWISKEAMERFIANLQKPKPPRLFPVTGPRERPLPLAERTERLLELARLHSLSPASELWYPDSDTTAQWPQAEAELG
jgi:hypothetical protein